MRKFTADPQALFQYRGLPPVGLTVSMALQHLVSMIVGCVTPAIIIAHAAALTHNEQVLLIQASLVPVSYTHLPWSWASATLCTTSWRTASPWGSTS